MRVLIPCAIAIALLFVTMRMPAISAEQVRPEGAKSPAPIESDAPGRSPLTGKERLSRKWTDEQRTDDCKVPPEKRGPPRPDCSPAQGR
jgi:hypothetical protein